LLAPRRGASRFHARFRWCRSFLARPPAKGYDASGVATARLDLALFRRKAGWHPQPHANVFARHDEEAAEQKRYRFRDLYRLLNEGNLRESFYVVR